MSRRHPTTTRMASSSKRWTILASTTLPCKDIVRHIGLITPPYIILFENLRKYSSEQVIRSLSSNYDGIIIHWWLLTWRREHLMLSICTHICSHTCTHLYCTSDAVHLYSQCRHHFPFVVVDTLWRHRYRALAVKNASQSVTVSAATAQEYNFPLSATSGMNEIRL